MQSYEDYIQQHFEDLLGDIPLDFLPILTGSTPSNAIPEMLERKEGAPRKTEFQKHTKSKHFDIDLLAFPDHYEVYAELPGISKKDINIHVNDKHLLSIEVSKIEPKTEMAEGTPKALIRERKYGDMKRVLRLSRDADVETDLKADLADGVLKIMIPRSKPEMKSKKIEVL
ncbi:hypothetical protein O9G_001714 [Rozella allomycis CSF55]|uniref:SHSP domain-containing protein n=1 Tax=Rozella allomycis (strain CSF55) TaxID=988480 RepID=A0A075AX50_ROZAC|nr:hypothetical protein O9G_001714 [Rozella allomycis CSF55]|eukprot:EPZ33302.1 hypothetical protein O9G_001714 [Rozella allomycis CSF55]